MLASAALIAGAVVLMTGCSPGPTVSEERDVDEFSRITLSGIGTLYITQDGHGPLRVEAGTRLIDRIKTDVRGDTLHIEYDTEFWTFLTRVGDVDLEVSVDELERIDLSGAGGIEIGELEADRLKIIVSGAGNIEIEELDAEELEIEVDGAGSITLEGVVDEQELRISGAGDYDAADLESDYATIDMSGAGSAAVWVERELDVDVSGAGSVSYYGNPRVTQDITGAGSLSGLGER
jgi:hypothetical protein